jgi:O-antigen/teichoic acid export membrane protein
MRIPRQIVGLADQTVVSGSNFVVLIVVGRTLAPIDFGYFVLAFTLLQSAGAVQSALITRPHNVLGATRQGEDYRRYTTASAFLQIVYAIAWALLLLVIAAVTGLSGSPSSTTFLVAAPVAIAWQAQEFLRRVLYTERRLHIALLDDILSYGSQAAILVWLGVDGTLTATRALVVVGATSLFSALAVLPFLRHSLARDLSRDALRSNWHFGRWLGAAEVVYWLASQSYIYVGGLVVGPVVSAALKAAQTLLGPVSVFLAFFVSYLPTSFARAQERDELARRMRAAFTVTVPPTLVYALGAIVFAPTLLRHVYGAEYAHDATVVRLFAVYYVILSVSDVFVAALAARGLTRRIFVGHALGAAISLVVGWALLLHWHAAGGTAGMILSLLGALILFILAFGMSSARRERQPGGATASNVLPRRDPST